MIAAISMDKICNGRPWHESKDGGGNDRVGWFSRAFLYQGSLGLKVSGMVLRLYIKKMGRGEEEGWELCMNKNKKERKKGEVIYWRSYYISAVAVGENVLLISLSLRSLLFSSRFLSLSLPFLLVFLSLFHILNS